MSYTARQQLMLASPISPNQLSINTVTWYDKNSNIFNISYSLVIKTLKVINQKVWLLVLLQGSINVLKKDLPLRTVANLGFS